VANIGTEGLEATHGKVFQVGTPPDLFCKLFQIRLPSGYDWDIKQPLVQ